MQDDAEVVRVAAATALGKFAMLSELGKLRPYYAAKVRTALLAAIENREESIEVKRRALEAISPLSLPQVKQLIGDAYTSEDPKLKVSAIYAMGMNCDLVWLPILIEELSSADPEMRFEAARACGELEEEEAVPYLIPLTYDEDFEVKVAAIEALGQIGGKEAKQALRRLLDELDSRVCEAAEAALHELELGEC
jgi:HEAT repeat protein